MSDLKQQWKQLGDRFNANSRRERMLLATAAIGGVLLLGFTLLVDPNLARARQANRLAEQQTNDLHNVEAQLLSVKAQLQVDPDAGRKAEIEKLRAELQKVEGAVRNLEGGLVAPERMNVVLERLLAANSNLRLLSLKSQAPVNLAEAGTTQAAASDAQAPSQLGLYRHGVEIRLEGTYIDLHAWLNQLENTQEKILWGDVRLQVTEHPRSVLSLTIFTLSTDKAWLAI